MTAAPRPDWIAPGTRVIVVSSGGAGTHSEARVTTIDKVNPKTFRIAAESVLFQLDRVVPEYAESQRIGGEYGHTRRAYPLDSPRGQAEYTVMRERKAIRRADAAYATWRKDRSESNRRAVVEALEALAPPTPNT